MSDRAYEKSMELCDYITEGGKKPKKVEKLWHAAFDAVLCDYGFNRKAREAMWDELVLGNWRRLHPTDAEDSMGPAAWLDKLRWDVLYFSDRWSIDRLCRAHWAWRNYMIAVEREGR